MRRAVVLLAVLLLVSACSLRVGAPAAEKSWRDDADKALGAAMSSLGTAQLVLEHTGKLPHPDAVVTMQDAITGLQRQSGTFLATQPPDGLHEQNETVATALGNATALLTRISNEVASPGLDAASARPLLARVKSAYAALDDLRAKVSGK